MSVTDPISDFIIQIKNAGNAGRAFVAVPASKIKIGIAELLKDEGYLASVEKHGRKAKKLIEVGIKYEDEKTPRVVNVKRISKPSRRVYLGAGDIRPVLQGHGILVLSTPEGVMTGDQARKRGVGGEALFEIW